MPQGLILALILAALVSFTVFRNRKRGLRGFLRHEVESAGKRLAGVWSGMKLVTILMLAVLIIMVIATALDLALVLYQSL